LEKHFKGDIMDTFTTIHVAIRVILTLFVVLAIAALRRFRFAPVMLAMLFVFRFSEAQETNPGQRLTPSEIDAVASIGAGAGTSGVNGIQTRVLKGDPNKPGLYTIQLTVPANTKIEAHTHPDDRVATVISGTWYIGYSSRFDEKKLKPLTPGSFYTEPPSVAHFARTGNRSVVIQITGYGPTGTTYMDSK
jgi:quercetin dioxygenase-like cupin family protein